MSNPFHDDEGKFTTGGGIVAHTERAVAYQAALAKRGFIEAELKKHSDVLRALPRGPMNLIPDDIKATPHYKETKAASDAALKKLKDFNGAFTKTFAAEIKANRKFK